MRFLSFLLLALALPAQAQDALSGVVINEILADPVLAIPGTPRGGTDTDGDGSFEFTDEYVELYNTTAAPVDISGWELYDAQSALVFPAGTFIAANGYIVVVREYTGTPPANYFSSRDDPNASGQLNLNSDGDDVYLYDPTADQYIAAAFGDQTVETGNFQGPNSATRVGNGEYFGVLGPNEAGLRTPDGSPLIAVGEPTPGAANPAPSGPQQITVSFAEASGVAAEIAGATGITVVVTTNDGQPLTRTVSAETDLTGGTADAADFSDVPPGQRTVTFGVGTASGSTQDVLYTLFDDAEDEGTELAEFSLSAASSDSPDGFGRTTFTLSISDDDAPPAASPVVINEVDPDTPGQDVAEFVELFNTTGAPVALDGLVLVFFQGSPDADSYRAFDLDGETIPANGYFILCTDPANVPNCDFSDPAITSNLLRNDEDGVALYLGDADDFPNGTTATTVDLVDAVVYRSNPDAPATELPTLLGTGVVFDEGATPQERRVNSIQRFPDGTGPFVADVATPGLQNIPVELAQPLTARVESGRLMLSWSTASESNNAFFEVLARSADADAFAAIGRVDGAGTTSAPQQYALAAENLAPGRYRLRLRQVDLDGTAAVVSETEASISVAGTHRVSAVRPNPSAGQARLDVASARAEHITVTVYDALGRRVAVAMDEAVEAERSRSVALGAGLAPGLYVAVVQGERFRETRRFAVSR